LKILLFANTDWYLYNFRFTLAKELRELGNEVILLSSPGDFQDRILEEGFQWISIPFSRQGINPISEFQTIIRVIRIYRQVKPDIVHHFTVKPVIYGSISAHVLRIKGIINSITGLGHIFIDTGFITRILRGLIKILYRLSLRSTQVIFENPEDQDTFIQNRLLQQRQSHLIFGTGVDTEKFRPSPKKEGIPLVLFASRLLASKGILEFVEAAQQLKQKGSSARFAIAGTPDPGNPASIAPEQIEAWEQSGLVEIWGWQEDMPTVLAKADIFCLPSYREGVPSALLEACASGLPIVATNAPGCRDVVTNGVNGLLVPIADSSALADSLETLISNPVLRHEMGAAGREIAVQRFGIGKTNAETIKVYGVLGDIGMLK